MEKTIRYFDVMTVDGTVILRLSLHEKEIPLKDEAEKELDIPTNGQGMTDAQQRYLFRLLADQEIEGDEAYEKLKVLFQVDSLEEVTKMEASRMIEQFLEDAKKESKHPQGKAKGGDSSGPPF